MAVIYMTEEAFKVAQIPRTSDLSWADRDGVQVVQIDCDADDAAFIKANNDGWTI